MPFFDLNKISSSSKQVEASVCIVGGGIAGLVAAIKIAELNKQKKVVVIESGLKNIDDYTNLLNEIDNPFGHYKGALSNRLRCLGGTSLLWGGRLLPLAASDTGSRPHVGLHAWPIAYDDLNKYRETIEQLFYIEGSSYEEEIAKEIISNAGFPLGDIEIVSRFPKWPKFKNCNVAYLYKDKIKDLPNLDIWIGATVTGFSLNNSGNIQEVAAICKERKSLKVKASEFLLAAGTLETTRLLLLLNVGAGNQPFQNCKVLGRYFNDHLGLPVGKLKIINRENANNFFGYHFIGSTRRSLHFELSPKVQRDEGVGSAFCHFVIQAEPNPVFATVKNFLRNLQKGKLNLDLRDLYNLSLNSGFIFKSLYWRYLKDQFYWPMDLEVDVYFCIEQLPHYDNRIILSDKKDQFGVPMLRLEWKKMPLDEKTFQVCLDKMRSFWSRHNFQEYAEVELFPEVQLKQGSAMLNLSYDITHPAGSARMGVDPTESVVDPELRTHSISNLSVASAAVFPSSGSANPTYTIIQLALRAAEKISKRLNS